MKKIFTLGAVLFLCCAFGQSVSDLLYQQEILDLNYRALSVPRNVNLTVNGTNQTTTTVEEVDKYEPLTVNEIVNLQSLSLGEIEKNLLKYGFNLVKTEKVKKKGQGYRFYKSGSDKINGVVYYLIKEKGGFSISYSYFNNPDKTIELKKQLTESGYSLTSVETIENDVLESKYTKDNIVVINRHLPVKNSNYTINVFLVSTL